MSGIYLHIPFCKQACHYCDFHFSTNLSNKEQLVNCLIQELEFQKNYLNNEEISSIYFGGGTPSLLSELELNIILDKIYKNFSINDDAEITLEANPDDIQKENVKSWKSKGINRLSIGIQSFNNQHLKFMNRAHNSEEAISCIDVVKEVGIDNITIDLIYGIPSENHDILKEDLKQAFELNTNHISAYCLTIEEKTVFGHQVRKGKMTKPDDEFAAQQFEILTSSMYENGFEQYEISNFAKNNSYAKHNTNYWKQKNYLGIGPSAHSFNGSSRQYNVSNNNLYIKAIENGKIPFDIEHLTINDKTNEYLMTSLRTQWGCDLNYIKNINPKFLEIHQETINKLISKNLVVVQNQILYLSKQGKLLADRITEELFTI